MTWPGSISPLSGIAQDRYCFGFLNYTCIITGSRRNNCRSQWPRRLRHELFSSAETLQSWVRIPLEAWMSVCVYSVFLLFCV
jgi:hypothetical protein